MRTLWVKKEFFDLVVSGKKTLEVRVFYASLRTIKKQDILNLNNRFPIRVKDIRTYQNFEEMLSREDSSKIFPGESSEKILSLLRSFYPPEKERLGVIVFEVDAQNKRN